MLPVLVLLNLCTEGTSSQIFIVACSAMIVFISCYYLTREHFSRRRSNIISFANSPQVQQNPIIEYFICENEESLFLKKREALSYHYKYFSINHYSLRFFGLEKFHFDYKPWMDPQILNEGEKKHFLEIIREY